jgi:hypothetical protein
MNIAYYAARTQRELFQYEASQYDSGCLRTHVPTVGLRILQ